MLSLNNAWAAASAPQTIHCSVDVVFQSNGFPDATESNPRRVKYQSFISLSGLATKNPSLSMSFIISDQENSNSGELVTMYKAGPFDASSGLKVSVSPSGGVHAKLGDRTANLFFEGNFHSDLTKDHLKTKEGVVNGHYSGMQMIVKGAKLDEDGAWSAEGLSANPSLGQLEPTNCVAF